MNTYYITENNTGGYYVTDLKLTRPFVVQAESEEHAIRVFEAQFSVDWALGNTYTPNGNNGGSCECCGRRYHITDDWWDDVLPPVDVFADEVKPRRINLTEEA